jgi:hypothetical protein
MLNINTWDMKITINELRREQNKMLGYVITLFQLTAFIVEPNKYTYMFLKVQQVRIWNESFLVHLKQDQYFCFLLERLQTPWKPLSKLAEIRIAYLPNASPECYSYTSLIHETDIFVSIAWFNDWTTDSEFCLLKWSQMCHSVIISKTYRRN